MVRVWVLIALFGAAGCKKKEPPHDAAGAGAAEKPKHKHVHHEDDETPIDVTDADGGGSGDSDDGSGSDGSDSGSAVDKSAHRDPNGSVHGPGGPIFEGRGKLCDAGNNHCQRDGWFTAQAYASGKFYRAVPSFKLEGKWYNYMGEETEGKGFRTEVAKPSTIKVGKPVVVFTRDNEDLDKFTDVEYDALTSSRWKMVVVDQINMGGKWFGVRGWDDKFPIDTARIVVEQQ